MATKNSQSNIFLSQNFLSSMRRIWAKRVISEAPCRTKCHPPLFKLIFHWFLILLHQTHFFIDRDRCFYMFIFVICVELEFQPLLKIIHVTEIFGFAAPRSSDARQATSKSNIINNTLSILFQGLQLCILFPISCKGSRSTSRGREFANNIGKFYSNLIPPFLLPKISRSLCNHPFESVDVE